MIMRRDTMTVMPPPIGATMGASQAASTVSDVGSRMARRRMRHGYANETFSLNPLILIESANIHQPYIISKVPPGFL